MAHTYRSIIDAVRQRFIDAVKRPAYNYSLDRCEIAEWPSLESLNQDFGKTLFLIVPDTEVAVEMASWTVEKEAFVDLIAARLLAQGDQDSPWQQSRIEDARHLAQTKLVEDVDKAIYSWNYTAYAENIEITERDRSAERTYVEGWAVVFFRLRFQWEEVWRVA